MKVSSDIGTSGEVEGGIRVVREPAARSRVDVEVLAGIEAPNAEWELSELVDAVSAELRRAAARVAADALGAGPRFAPARVELELGVRVRREADGRVLFRTADERETESVLRLDFSRVLRASQVVVEAVPDERLRDREVPRAAQRDQPDAVAAPVVEREAPFVEGPRTLPIADERDVDAESERAQPLDPFLHMLDLGPDDIVAKVFAGLMRVDPASGRLIPAAGEFGGGEPEDGATSVEVRLKRGLRFHDGTPVTGADVKFTYEMPREMDESPWQWFVEQYVAWVEAEEECVWFGLTVPFARVPRILWTIGIVPERLYGTDEFERRPVGCGERAVEKAIARALAD